VRSLVLVLGDQLDDRSAAFDGFDPARDAVLMMEVSQESRHVASHMQRTVLFLSAMRHFAAGLSARGVRVRYISLDDPDNTGSFPGETARVVRDLRPERLVLVEPGEHRVSKLVRGWAREFGLPVDARPDRHFLTTDEQFAAWAGGRKSLTMEYFYREQRKRLGVLMEPDGQPTGGAWNFDAQNRESFGKDGPRPPPPPPVRFEPDAVTLGVIDAVRRVLPDLPGRLNAPGWFGWPVTRAQALEQLRDFIDNRLAFFGPFEDAMWTGEPFLYHSLLSAPLNLKLLDPRECVGAALEGFRRGRAPLQSVEGFVRQIIGWREYIRGVYRLEGPGYAGRNHLGHAGRLPELYWTGETDMACLRECVGQVLDHAFGHHIQRLMVTGNFALISGVHPRAVSDWYLGMYVDAVDWVTLPNTLGMSQHADAPKTGPRRGAPVVGTKPYISGGAYIKRMSNYCGSCRYDPARRTGERACPFTVFYWDFLSRHRDRFERNPRMAQMIRNLDRFSEEELVQITITAGALRRRLGIDPDAEAGPAPPGPAEKATLFDQRPPTRRQSRR
jgi:deoxyribodipyrimidine photolyase-related protein